MSLLSLIQSLGVVATMLEMNGAVVSGVHVRLAGVVCGLVVVQRWPGSPFLAQISVTALSGQVVTSLDEPDSIAPVCEELSGLTIVSALPKEEPMPMDGLLFPRNLHFTRIASLP